MNPIINPLWFYLFSIVDDLKRFFTVIFIMYVSVTILMVVFGPIILDDVSEFTKKHTNWFTHKWLKRGLLIAFISFLIACAVPSEKTCYQMLVASMVTENNIEYVGDKATDLIDYIIDKVDKTLDEEEAK